MGSDFKNSHAGEIADILRGRSFSSLEEAQAFAEAVMAQRNTQPLDSFEGLTPEMMHAFLYLPFDSPKLVQFPTVLDVEPKAGIMTLFALLAEEIGEKGLKTTATGNLPRGFCRTVAKLYYPDNPERDEWCDRITGEFDFPQMNITRLVAEMAGLIHARKGRFFMTRKYHALRDTQGPAGTYPLLFKTYAWQFNWEFNKAEDELPIIQMSFLFSAYLLVRHGDALQPETFYQDRFMRAFPSVLEMATTPSELYREAYVRHRYASTCLDYFFAFCGLAEYMNDPLAGYRERKLRATPLLSQVIRFGFDARKR